MPSKSATDKTNSKDNNGAHGAERQAPAFVQYRLTEEELSQAKNAADTFSDVGEIIAQLVEEGYKVSCSHDTYGGGTQVFITPVSKENPNAGWTLTARAPTLVAAIAVICWKHYTLFSQDWPKDASQRSGSNWG